MGSGESSQTNLPAKLGGISPPSVFAFLRADLVSHAKANSQSDCGPEEEYRAWKAVPVMVRDRRP